MVFEDRSLTCADCGDSFTFSADDQRYHEEKGYTNEPKRCPDCRRARRTRYNDERMGGDSPRQMHPIVCDECGKDAEVPFLPRGDRPVYCGDCYSQQRSGGP